MAGEKLMVKFTGQKGLRVYERLKSEVNSEWDRLQKTQLRKSFKLRSPEAVMEDIVVKALDRFLGELPAKDALERKVGQTISDAQWDKMVSVDGAFSLEELRQTCRKRGLKHTGDKKELAGRLLGYWP